MAKVLKSLTLAQFKSVKSIAALEGFKSKKGNLYLCDKGTGEFQGMCADDFDSTKPIMSFEMSDEDTGDTWWFFGNGTPREAEFEL